MAKSRTLRNQLNECGAFEILNNLLDTKYNASVTGRRSAENLQGVALMSSMKEQSVGQWIASAVDTLQSQTSMTVTSKDLETSRESRTSTPGAGNMSSIAGSSSNLWNGIESSAVATSKAVFGVAPNMRRFSSDVPPS